MAKLMVPDDFELIIPVEELDIHILTSHGEICKQHFETWLSDHSKLEWCDDTSDHTGEHVQRSGTWSIDEYYYHVTGAELLRDMYTYMMYIRIEPRLQTIRNARIVKLPNLTEQAKKLKSLI